MLRKIIPAVYSKIFIWKFTVKSKNYSYALDYVSTWRAVMLLLQLAILSILVCACYKGRLVVLLTIIYSVIWSMVVQQRRIIPCGSTYNMDRSGPQVGGTYIDNMWIGVGLGIQVPTHKKWPFSSRLLISQARLWVRRRREWRVGVGSGGVSSRI